MNQRKSAQDRKADILAATLGLAFEVGPDHVTTSMIAERLGLTQPAIYKHYASKEDIWCAVSETLSARIIENAREDHPANHAAMDRLRQLVMSQIELIAQIPALPEIMVARDPSGTLSRARCRIQAAMGELRRAMGQTLDRARAAGHLRPDLSSADGVALVIGVVQSLVLRLIVTRDPTTLVQEGARLLDLQLSLIARNGAEA